MKKSFCIILIFLFIHLSLDICHWSFADEYRLGPSDTLEITVPGRKDLDIKQMVAPDGQISVPFLGIISVEGQSVNDLQKYLTEGYSHFIKKSEVVISLTPKPIYVVQYDLKRDVWEVKQAKSIDEANALMGGRVAECRDAIPCVSSENASPSVIPAKAGIQFGEVYRVDMGTKPDFWESNWYKVITATAVMVGIYSTMNR